MSEKQQLCTFHVADLICAVEVSRVQEVLRPQKLTRIPQAPLGADGLINLRGQIVLAINLRQRLGQSQRATDEVFMNVVLRTEDGPVSLLVDHIGDVLEVEQDSFVKPPETLRGSVRDMIVGAFQLPNCLCLLLNSDETLNLAS